MAMYNTQCEYLIQTPGPNVTTVHALSSTSWYYDPMSHSHPIVYCQGPWHGYWHGLKLISAWISNYIHYKVWDEIINSFINFNLSMLGLKLNLVSKSGPRLVSLIKCHLSPDRVFHKCQCSKSIAENKPKPYLKNISVIYLARWIVLWIISHQLPCVGAIY